MPRPHKPFANTLRFLLLLMTLSFTASAFSNSYFQNFEGSLTGWTVSQAERSTYAAINGSYGFSASLGKSGYIQKSVTFTGNGSADWLVRLPYASYPTVAFSGGPEPVCIATTDVDGYAFHVKRCSVSVPPGSYTFRWTMTSLTSGFLRADFNDLDDIQIQEYDSLDTDNDLVPNASDNCPSNANTDQLNTDGDMQGDVCDTDDDNDGVVDTGDVFPFDNTQAGDIDTDGIDGFVDNCPSNANADQLNTDGDVLGNVCDMDDDNDGVEDWFDNFPVNVAVSVDGDNDGFANSWNAACNTTCQANSGLVLDNCQYDANVDQLNTDGDTQGDVCDTDDDNDGVADAGDAFPLDNTQAGDVDADGFEGLTDNCPSIANADQLNTDGDTQGDVCDTDDDNDGVEDWYDKFPLNAAASSDSDNDGFPGSWNGACDATCQANSGLVMDNCPSNANADQLDTDGDGQGNACDTDDDNDGESDAYELLHATDPLNASSNGGVAQIISFENGVPSGWTKPAAANASWVSDVSQASHLGKSLRSGAISHNGKAQIQFTANIAGAEFSFDVKTSAEANNDVFRVYVDGVGSNSIAGITDWQTRTVTVTPGIHVIKFEYAKNGSVIAGSDAVWIDKLVYADGTDTDGDGQRDAIDADDDNDGLPDVMDPLPLQSKFNLNAPYKGSQVKDQNAVQ